MNTPLLQDTECNGIHGAYRLIARHLYRNRGEFAYQAFDWINRACFDGAVPETLIVWDITEHGQALGWCRSSDDGPPIIKLHPSILGASSHATRYRHNGHCFGYPTELLGPCFAFDVLLHEMMHAHVNYNLGGDEGCSQATNGPTASPSLWTCHNCPNWVNECNRIGRILGLDIDAQMTVVKRVNGKSRRANGGNIDVERFPHELRTSFYQAGRLPWETLRGIVRNTEGGQS